MNKEHYDILLMQGVEVWNQWRKDTDIIPDLNRANLIGANLNRANLNRANLRGASLNRANLNRANLRGASLVDANLDGANLNHANLNGANLNRANLNRANLRGASLVDANLDGANLNHANLDFASWPLWCGSANVIIDAKIAKQLLAHAFNVARKFFPGTLTQEQINWLNSFHKIQSDEFPKFE